MNLFKRLKGAVSKTRENVKGRIRELMGTGRRLDQDMLDELEEILLTADIGMEMCDKIILGLREVSQTDAETDLDLLIENQILALLKEKEIALADESAESTQSVEFTAGHPRVILVVGVNGAGKTTTIGKLAASYVSSGHKVLLAAADTFRAAAIEQLEVWADRANVEIIKSVQGADPASVAFDALNAAMARGYDTLIVDTAGRLHNKKNLMLELDKIRRVLDRQLPGSPHEILLVLDGTTGQNALSQARLFSESSGVSGLVITKLDGTARGGIALAIHYELGIPVKWIGVGEAIDDLQQFDASAYARALFEGLGENIIEEQEQEQADA
jgi:fused signal recognition particle receptor